jgi:dihydroxyacetone kinase-like protein
VAAVVITAEQIIRFLQRLNEEIAAHRDELTRLDAAIGDADHGTNLHRGFAAVMEKLPSFAGKDVGTILKTTGLTLVSTVGGASGPLYGTGFMRAGMVLVNHHEIDRDAFVEAWSAALEGIQARGRAQRGEKTMVDAIAPAVDVLRQAGADGDDLLTALRAAVAAAQEGMLATIPMQATKGRASYLGERSVGHQDPGATSAHLMLRVLLEVVEGDAA